MFKCTNKKVSSWSRPISFHNNFLEQHVKKCIQDKLDSHQLQQCSKGNNQGAQLNTYCLFRKYISRVSSNTRCREVDGMSFPRIDIAKSEKFWITLCIFLIQ